MIMLNREPNSVICHLWKPYNNKNVDWNTDRFLRTVDRSRKPWKYQTAWVRNCKVEVWNRAETKTHWWCDKYIVFIWEYEIKGFRCGFLHWFPELGHVSGYFQLFGSRRTRRENPLRVPMLMRKKKFLRARRGELELWNLLMSSSWWYADSGKASTKITSPIFSISQYLQWVGSSFHGLISCTSSLAKSTYSHQGSLSTWQWGFLKKSKAAPESSLTAQKSDAQMPSSLQLNGELFSN